MKYTIHISKKCNLDTRRQIGQLLWKYNQEALQNYESPVRLEMVVKDKRGNVLGGLYGESYWGWMYVNFLVVRKEFRRKGIGTELMKQVERETLKRCLHKIRLNTFGFQAPDFYKKLGFDVVAVEEGFPEGSQTYYMQKVLSR